jgi:hypothetical protein
MRTSFKKITPPGPFGVSDGEQVYIYFSSDRHIVKRIFVKMVSPHLRCCESLRAGPAVRAGVAISCRYRCRKANDMRLLRRFAPRNDPLRSRVTEGLLKMFHGTCSTSHERSTREPGYDERPIRSLVGKMPDGEPARGRGKEQGAGERAGSGEQGARTGERRAKGGEQRAESKEQGANDRTTGDGFT